MAGGRGPTLRRRRLAAELRILRERSGLTGEQAGDRLGWSVSKVSRIETAQVGVRTGDLTALLDLYGVSGTRREALKELARTAMQRGWWDTYETISTDYANYISLESEATAIRCFSQTLIHGLLQTEDYARAVIKAALVPFTSASEVDRRVEIRMTRQKILHRDSPLSIWMVLDEASLHRLIGGADVMRSQCEALVRLSELPNVTIQILASSVGAHPGANTPFSILSFPEVYDPDVVYIETMMSSLWIEDDREVHRYSLTFDQMRAMALSPDGSVELISEVVGRLWREEDLPDMHTSPIDPTALAWRKSRRSDGGNGCVEVAAADAAPADAPHKAGRGPLVLFRDSENPTGPVLAFTRSELQAFLGGVKDGEFDDLI